MSKKQRSTSYGYTSVGQAVGCCVGAAVGAALGFALAIATLFGLGSTAAAIEAPLLPTFAFEAWCWGVLGALPLAMALVVMATARLTVLRALARMP